jgi:hypothetical protein
MSRYRDIGVVPELAGRRNLGGHCPSGAPGHLAYVTTSARTPSRSTARNAQLREVLTAQFTGVKFAVRNGPHASAAVSWQDGPTQDAVRALLRETPCDSGSHWAVRNTRRLSPAFMAVAYLLERDSGSTSYFSEKDYNGRQIPAGEVRPTRDVLMSWGSCGEDLDAADVSVADWARAQVVLSLAGPLPTSKDDMDAARPLARCVFHHGHVVDAVCR